MKYILTTILVVIFALQSYSQQQLSTKKAHQKMESIYKDVAHKKNKINYVLKVSNNECNYKIWVNDVPVYHIIKNRSLELSFMINAKILKSGIQTLKIKIYPFRDKVNRKWKDKIDPYAGLDITISETIWDTEFKEFDDTPIFSYQTPREENLSLLEKRQKLKFKDGKELQFYEETTTFEANVPYNLKGWSESVDLSKEDPEKLFKEVEVYYLELIKDFENKNIPAIAEKYYNKEKEVAQSFFFNKKDVKNRWHEDFLSDVLDPSAKLKELKKHYLEIDGNGKIVYLSRPPGNSPVTIITENENGRKRYSKYQVYLHRPKPGAPLEMIR